MAISRRDFLRASSLLALQARPAEPGVLVNDIHSQLNPTRVREVVNVSSISDLQRALRQAAASRTAVSIAGGRHAMGAQQFAEQSMLLDTTRFNRVRSFDRAGGIVDVEAGIMWPALVDYLSKAQDGRTRQWGIAQKQTGADRLSIGGALSANVHGRGLKMKPFIADVESFVLIDARGNAVTLFRSPTPADIQWHVHASRAAAPIAAACASSGDAASPVPIMAASKCCSMAWRRARWNGRSSAHTT